MFSKILIANRGEIACRVIKTCKRLGVKTVVVYSEADAGSLAVELADETVFIGGSASSESYLVQDKIIAAVKETGAEAVHPGFGFLSENAEFARRLEKEKITFIGPNPIAIEAMGDKITSKKFAAEAGVSTVPGHMGLIEDAEEAVKISQKVGYPVMIKASAGGGGKGMRIAWNDDEAREGFRDSKAEAKGSFGDDRIFIEKFITEPRHIEIQVLGDKHGHCIHLNERECSIQRRNQKVVEEAPSPFIDAKTRAAMGKQSIALAKAVNYDSAGTVEFIVDKDKNFYFLEMNTRLQVEHPVTEMTTGIDLVEQMLLVAYGETLNHQQNDIGIKGWAVETRIYAEDPYRSFLPSIGRLKRCQFPPEGKLGKGEVRIDTGVREGDEISMFYDPMIAKLITHGKTRDDAIDVHEMALDRLRIEGIQDNSPFLQAVIAQERFKSGKLTTNYIPDEFPDGFNGVEPSKQQEVLLASVAAYIHDVFVSRADKISNQMDPGRAIRKEWVVSIDRKPISVSIASSNSEAEIKFKGKKAAIGLSTNWKPGMGVVEGLIDNTPFAVRFEDTSEGYVLRHRGVTAKILVLSPTTAELYAKLPEKEAPDLSKLILSPMPGLIVSMAVELGQDVKAGEAVCVVEAMKMQNIIRAEADGKVQSINAAAGDSVAADAVLVEFE
ncbi:acetyl-CoA carboxylase biotin carboxylase subunit [Hirschia baltica]|uniref:propionyl-CoA carboxylase n=1 Tax=Hirschia baltica (strain ATCC 49814 / DSM 5838 / IFAM 1418) TaxID=582402 RepID=C6XLC8_HIRBI|nr:acetyl/propionyl/methylcrotonyl-CoA carboxylase subunit alpha [Hirschia baltica]ACT59727.1 Carbamoyl-phosphate synthase L chain ATP-binding [Hirschia baltica ATCC 49814]